MIGYPAINNHGGIATNAMLPPPPPKLATAGASSGQWFFSSMAAVVRDCFLTPCARPVYRRQTILLPMSTPTECPSHAAVPRTSACILPHSAEEINSLCAQPSANLVLLLDADIYTNVPVLHATAIFNFAAKPPVTLLRTRGYCRSNARLRAPRL